MLTDSYFLGLSGPALRLRWCEAFAPVSKSRGGKVSRCGTFLVFSGHRRLCAHCCMPEPRFRVGSTIDHPTTEYPARNLALAQLTAPTRPAPVSALTAHARDALRTVRSEERPVGQRCGSTCRTRWSPVPY